MENQEQTEVLCVRTINGVNIPVARIRQLYLERPEKLRSLVGEIRFCAVIGEQDDSTFHYFDQEDCIKLRLHDAFRVYDGSITTVDLAKKVYQITDRFTQDEMRIFLYMRCVIPKGARYYIGTGRDYCSDSLIVTGRKTRTMKRWVAWSPCLHSAFIDPAVAGKVEKETIKEIEAGKEADHVS